MKKSKIIHVDQILEALYTAGPKGCTILELSEQFDVTKKVIKKFLVGMPRMWLAWEDRIESKVYFVHWSYRSNIHPADLVEVHF